jgi:hypothetical protein
MTAVLRAAWSMTVLAAYAPLAVSQPGLAWALVPLVALAIVLPMLVHHRNERDHS